MTRDIKGDPTVKVGSAVPNLRPSDTRLSPDQTIRLDLLISEWSPSLWTHAPRVTEVATGRVLLDLWGTNWDADAAWIGTSGLRLGLRRYDRGGAFTMLIDFASDSFRIAGTAGEARPLADVRQGMDEAFGSVHQRYLDSLTDAEYPLPDGIERVPPVVTHDGAPIIDRLRNILRRALSFSDPK